MGLGFVAVSRPMSHHEVGDRRPTPRHAQAVPALWKEKTMNRCPKCHGCLYVDEDIEFGIAQLACINCGYRPLVVTRPPDPVPQGRPKRDRCLNCRAEPEPGFQQCRYHRDYQKAYKRRHPDPKRRKVAA